MPFTILRSDARYVVKTPPDTPLLLSIRASMIDTLLERERR